MPKFKVGTKTYSLAEMRANPRLRGKLKAKYLTPEQQAMRKENTRLKAPAGPGSSITNREMESLIGSTFGGQQKALDQRKADIPVWFNQYRERLGQMQREQGIRQQAAQDAIKSFASQAAQNSQTATQSAVSTNPQGQQVDPNAGARQAAAENVRQSLIGSYGAMGAQLGIGQANLSDSVMNQSYGMENTANMDLQKLFAALGEQKVKFKQSTLADESKSKLEAAAFGLKKSDTRADNALNAKKYAETVRSHKASEANARARLKKMGKGANGKDQYGNTQKDIRNNRDTYKGALSLAKGFSKGNSRNAAIKDYSQMVSALVANGFKAPYAKAAAEKVLKGKVSSAGRRGLAEYGVTP